MLSDEFGRTPGPAVGVVGNGKGAQAAEQRATGAVDSFDSLEEAAPDIVHQAPIDVGGGRGEPGDGALRAGLEHGGSARDGTALLVHRDEQVGIEDAEGGDDDRTGHVGAEDAARPHT